MTASFTWGLVIQSGVVLAGALVLALLGHETQAMGWFVGALIALANSALLVWRWHQGRRVMTSDPGRHMRFFYRSMIERYVGLVVLLGGALWLQLNALTLLAGFITGQIGWLVAALVWRNKA
jgi:hypothetical protein